VYHHDALGSGVDPSGTSLSPATAAWTSPVLDGKIYGEPLVEAGRVVVATLNDTIYELSARTGSVIWSTHVASPVPSSSVPCGDINPTVGITSTPVIDPATGEVFVVADEAAGSGASHHMIGLDLFTGAVRVDVSVDPPGSHPLYQLQRAALTLDAGQVIVGFGGNDGDCETAANPYHGWVVAVPEGGGGMRTFEVASNPGDSQGAIWMGGASPLVDARGNIWLATGNSSFTSSSNPYDNSDAVLELSPTLALEQAFAPSTWFRDNAGDIDLGSSSPALLADGLVLQAGKSHAAYLLSQSSLGGVGGQQTSLAPFCGADVDGGNAVDGSVVYAPCLSGVMAAQVGTAPASIHVLWHTSTGSTGSPIVAGGLVWTINPSNGTLNGLDPKSGSGVQTLALGSVANHFPSPTVADGLLLAASTNQVHAFMGPAGLPPAPPAPGPRPGYWTAGADGGVFAFGGAAFYGSLGGRPLAAPVVNMAATSDGHGYWLVASDGGVFAFGDAAYRGSMGGRPLNAPIVGIAPTPSGGGYWLVASDGGVFAFGDAAYRGSMGGRPLNAPVVGIAPSPTGGGYWLVASDGGVFGFGDAAFHGSMGGHPLNAPVVGIAGDHVTSGYWLVAADGAIFSFGGSGFFGSMGGRSLAQPVVGMTGTSNGGGYWLVASDGGIFSFGDAVFEGSTAGIAPARAVAAPPLP
jgi:hypothetical protein